MGLVPYTQRVCLLVYLLLLPIILAQTTENITICVLSDDIASATHSFDAIYKTQTEFLKDSFDRGLLEWKVGSTTFNPIFDYIDTGFREAGNGKATFPFGDVYKSHIDYEYDFFVERVNEADPNCDAWLAQPTSKQGIKAKDVMFDADRRNQTVQRTNITLHSEVVDKILMTILASDPGIYNEPTFPNLFGPYLSTKDQAADFLNAMWEKGARTVGFILEDDRALDNVFQRVIIEYLNETSLDWVLLNEPHLIPLSPRTDARSEPDFALYSAVVDEIYEEQHRHRKDLKTTTNDIPDCMIISSAIDGNGDLTMQYLHDLRLGADALLWISGASEDKNITKELFPGMIVPSEWENDYVNEDISDAALFLGTTTYIQQIHQDYFEEVFKSRVPASFSISTLNAVQTLQLAMVRANCQTVGAGFARCIHDGIDLPCSSVADNSSCPPFGVNQLNVSTWFGQVVYQNNQLRSPSSYHQVTPVGEASAELTASDIRFENDDGPFAVRFPLHPDTILRIFVGVACGLGVIGCLVGIVGVQVKSSVLIVRSAAPLFLQLLLAGSALMYTSLFFLIFDNLAVWECTAWQWCSYVGWAIAFVSLLVKTHRVDQVFKSVTKTKLHDNRLLRNWWLPMVGAFILFCIFFTVFDKIELVVKHGGQDLWEECNLETPGMYAGLGMQGVILIWAAILAFKVRNAPSSFNEATLISVSVYNWLVVETVAIVLLFILPDGVNNQLIMLFLYTWLPLTIMLLMMFVPKIRAIHRGKGDQVSTMNTSRAPSRAASAAAAVNNASMSEKTVSGTQAHNEVRKLRAEVGRLVNENTRLTEVLTMIHNPHVDGGEEMATHVMNEQKNKSLAMQSIHDPPPVVLPAATDRQSVIENVAKEDDDECAESIDALSV